MGVGASDLSENTTLLLMYYYSTKPVKIIRLLMNVNICMENSIYREIFIFCVKRYFSYYLK